jgi:hypothetical protein
MELTVALIKPKAERYSRDLGQVIEIDVKQYTIMVNGKGIGYVCQANGLPINWLPVANAYPPEAIAKLNEAVNAELIRLHGPEAGNRPASTPDDQETVDKALEIAAKFANRESLAESPDDQNL